MPSFSDPDLVRRSILRWTLLGAPAFLAGGPLSACAATPRIYFMSVSRNAGCGCCHEWTALMQRSGHFQTSLRDEADMPAMKRRLGVPGDLAACHTAEVEDYVIEGHVPVEDALRLLTDRPAGVRGLAVAGMPSGSPGMEQPDGAHDPFVVFAFRRDGGRAVFTRYV